MLRLQEPWETPNLVNRILKITGKKKEEMGSDDALGRTDVEESTSGAIQ